MITILKIIQSTNTSIALEKMLKQLKIKIISGSLSYSSYIKSLQYRPDVIIMDIPKHPEKTLKFVKLIRANEKISHMPILAMGPDFQDNVKEIFNNIGIDKYLPYPLKIRALLEDLKELLKNKTQHERKRLSTDVNQLDGKEIKQLTDRSVPDMKKLEIMTSHIGKLMAFPASVAGLLKVSGDDKSGANDLATIINSDPSISAEVLRLANSVVYTARNKKTVNIKDAVVRIGFEETKNVAMSISVFKSLKDKNYETGFNHRDFWYHSLSTAIIAEYLARKSSLVPPDEAFLLGLMHDLGILLLDEYFNSIFLLILKVSTDEGLKFVHRERQITSITHNDLVIQLFKKWNFPEALISSIKDFNNIDTLSAEDLKTKPLSSIVKIAEIITHSLKIGGEADACISPINADVMKQLRMPHGLQKAFLDYLYTELNKFNSFLRVDDTKFPEDLSTIHGDKNIKVLTCRNGNELYDPVTTYLKIQGISIKEVNPAGSSCCDVLHEANLLFFPDMTKEHYNKVEKAATMQMEAYIPNKKSDDFISVNSKIICLDPQRELNPQHSTSSLYISRFPLDLRCLEFGLLNIINDERYLLPVNDMGSLKNAEIKKRNALIINKSGNIRDSFTNILSKEYNIENTTEGPKGLNIAKTMKTELHLAIIELSVGLMRCEELVRALKLLPQHKRCRYIITIDKPQKEHLIPIVKMGIKEFIHEQLDPKMLHEQLKSLKIINIDESFEEIEQA